MCTFQYFKISYQCIRRVYYRMSNTVTHHLLCIFVLSYFKFWVVPQWSWEHMLRTSVRDKHHGRNGESKSTAVLVDGL